ncbi:MAG: 50S ribosomal protein L25 [Candidatus Kerfeldbacteria bacterium]|nr:50S ribosomal protein L25 [Candidatus Kerfeldbacteria bacterium]
MTENPSTTLRVTQRQQSKQHNTSLRQAGFIPAVVYGHRFPNTIVQVAATDFAAAYTVAGESSLIDLVIEQQPVIKVIIQAVAKQPITDEIQHIDFYVVNMTEQIQTEVDVEFVGIAPAVKELAGILVKNKSTLHIKCLPQHLIKTISVDLSALRTFEDAIFVRDVVVPETITVLEQPDDIVVKVTPPRSEAELAELDQAVTEDVSKVAGVVKEQPVKTEEKTESKKQD